MNRLVLSNGELHVELNETAELDTLCYPFIGHEHHTSDLKHKIGVWVDGETHWLDNADWQFKSRLPQGALITNTTARNENIGILLEFDDFVGVNSMAFFRNIHIVNLRQEARNIRLYLHQAFRISNYVDGRDTAQYLADTPGILHYRGRRAFVVGGMDSMGVPFDQWTVGKFGNGLAGSWMDAEDGSLSGCPNEVGLTDSVIGFSSDIPVLASVRVSYWLAVGKSPRTAISMHEQIFAKGIYQNAEKTENNWHKWLSPAFRISNQIEPTHQKKFIDSVIAIRAHIDLRGSIVSSQFCQIQEACYALWPLIRLGYKDEALNFFTFCKQIIDPKGGYLLPRYRADGAWDILSDEFDGQSRPKLHPEDTALVLFIITQFHAVNAKANYARNLYPSLIQPMSNFLASYVDKDTKLPITNSTYSSAIVYASLLASSEIAEQLERPADSVQWRSVANDILEASAQLFDDRQGYFVKSLSDKSLEIDSFFASFMFGLVQLDDDRLKRTFRAIKKLRLSSGLYCRHELSNQSDLLASLWVAQYLMEAGDKTEADKIIQAVSSYIGTSGAVKPIDELGNIGFGLSSTSEYVSTLLDTIIVK